MGLEAIAEGVTVNATNPKGLGKSHEICYEQERKTVSHEKMLEARKKNSKNIRKAASN